MIEAYLRIVGLIFRPGVMMIIAPPREDLGVIPLEESDEDLFMLYDASGLTDGKLKVSASVLIILANCDGKRDLAAVQTAFTEETGRSFSDEEFEKVISQLDEALLLDSPAFWQEKRKIQEAFINSEAISSACAGSVYPKDKAELDQEVKHILAQAPLPDAQVILNDPPLGIVSPHIDWARGWEGYGQVWRELQGSADPEVVIILGTAHRPLPNYYCLTRKDFITPFGRITTNQELVNRILLSSPVDLLEGEFCHRLESSVELQLPFIQKLWKSATVVPILCGSLHQQIEENLHPESVPEVKTMISTLRESCANLGHRCLLIASADLSHVGPHFNDGRDLSGSCMQDVEEIDREYLKACIDNGAYGGLQALQTHNNNTNICGAAALYTLFAAADNQRVGGLGQVVGYHQAVSAELNQAVTYAGMIVF